MATVTYGDIPDWAVQFSSLALSPGFEVVSSTSTLLVIQDALGNRLELAGTGLLATMVGEDLIVSSGQIAAAVVRLAGGAVLLEATGLDLDAVTLAQVATTTGALGALQMVLSGRDRIFGGTGNDLIDGGAKSDVLRAGDGADTLTGGAGDDQMYGGRGGDVFVFQPKGGADVIHDFKDENVGSDDMILTTRKAFLNMVVTEDAGGVLLQFGPASLYVDGWTAAEVGRGDFLFM